MDQRPPRGSLRGPLASRRLRPVTAEGRHALVEVNAPAGRSSRGRGVRPFDRTPIVFACLPGPAPLSPRHSKPEPMHAEPVIMVVCPRSTMTNLRPCGGCGRPLGFVEVVEAVSHDPEDDLAAAPHESIEGARMADPGRMSPEEQEQAHALLTRALSDVDIHPLPVAGLAAVVVDKLGFVTEPDRAPIAGEHAVGAAKWFERLVATLVFSEDAVSVRGMEAGLPEIRGIAVLEGVSQAGLDLWALADPGADDAVVLDVGVAGICPVPESPVLGSTSVTSPSFANC
jgi:hypothetical protein